MSLILLSLMVLPLIGAAFIAFNKAEWAKWLGLGWSLITFIWSVIAALAFFDWSDSGSMQMIFRREWIPSIGVDFSLGVDAVALLLILLTTLLGPICMAASFTAINERRRLFYASLLVLQAAMTGVFASRDLALFYFCFEFTLAPMYVLINLYGSTNRQAAATKFFLYTFTGSLIALAGFLYTGWKVSLWNGGLWSFDIATLTEYASRMSATEQTWVMFALLAGFAVKVPLFPVHTWLPLAHTEAPTAGSVILAGVLLKLGTYGIFRFVLPFTPVAVLQYAPAIAILSIIGIIYAGLICWVQRDVKKLVAYSSVSHLGFCVLGLVALNSAGMVGSVMYMVNHGLSTGALFLLIGFMYERYHTRSLNEVGGLASRMPIWAFFMVFFTLASVGLPGLNGFVSEFLCMLGAYQSGATWGVGGTAGPLGPWFAVFAATGVIVSAIYLLFMVGRIVFGPLQEPADHHAHEVLPTDLSVREISTLAPLAILCLVLGVYPAPLLIALEGPVAETVAMYDEVRANSAIAEAPPTVDTIEGESVVLLEREDLP